MERGFLYLEVKLLGGGGGEAGQHIGLLSWLIGREAGVGDVGWSFKVLRCCLGGSVAVSYFVGCFLSATLSLPGGGSIFVE